MRLLCPLAAAVLTLVLASSAVAAPKHKIAFRLDYDAPDASTGCPDADELALMMAAEFGYLVVRTDVSAVLRVDVRRVGKDFEAELWAPDPAGNGKEWHWRTDKQGTCHELAYDLAALVKMALGPRAWGSEEPPPALAAPPDIEVGRPALVAPFVLRPYASVAFIPPGEQGPVAPPSTPATPVGEGAMRADVMLFGIVSPYGLSSTAVGGGGAFALRWPRFAVAAEIRGMMTPGSGIGDPPAPGRTSLLTGVVLPCFVVAPLDVCAVASISKLDFDLPPPLRLATVDGLTGGFGVRLVGRWQFAQRLALVGYGEVTGEVRHVTLEWKPTEGGTDPGYYWRSPTARVVLGVGLSVNVF